MREEAACDPASLEIRMGGEVPDVADAVDDLAGPRGREAPAAAGRGISL